MHQQLPCAPYMQASTVPTPYKIVKQIISNEIIIINCNIFGHTCHINSYVSSCYVFGILKCLPCDPFKKITLFKCMPWYSMFYVEYKDKILCKPKIAKFSVQRFKHYFLFIQCKCIGTIFDSHWSLRNYQKFHTYL